MTHTNIEMWKKHNLSENYRLAKRKTMRWQYRCRLPRDEPDKDTHQRKCYSWQAFNGHPKTNRKRRCQAEWMPKRCRRDVTCTIKAELKVLASLDIKISSVHHFPQPGGLVSVRPSISKATALYICHPKKLIKTIQVFICLVYQSIEYNCLVLSIVRQIIGLKWIEKWSAFRFFYFFLWMMEAGENKCLTAVSDGRDVSKFAWIQKFGVKRVVLPVDVYKTVSKRIIFIE